LIYKILKVMFDHKADWWQSIHRPTNFTVKGAVIKNGRPLSSRGDKVFKEKGIKM